MASNKSVRIRGKMKVVVESGEYGTYAKLVRKDNKCIKIYRKSWEILQSNVSAITENLEADSDYGFSLTRLKSVRLEKFEDRRYVKFHEKIEIENGVTLNKYINLKQIQWVSLCKAMHKIDKMFCAACLE